MGHAGTMLAFANGRVVTVTTWPGRGARPTPGAPGRGSDAHLPAARELLATSARNGTTRLWDPIRGQPIATLPGQLRGWEGGGSRLAVAGNEGLFVYRVAGVAERRTIDCRALSDQPYRERLRPRGWSSAPMAG